MTVKLHNIFSPFYQSKENQPYNIGVFQLKVIILSKSWLMTVLANINNNNNNS